MKGSRRSRRAMLIFCLMITCSLQSQAVAGSLSVFVSILPQKYFVQRIAGSDAQVAVMVPSGADPVTYEPSPRQMAALSQAKAYFCIGVPFEEAWLDKIQKTNANLVMIDTREGIDLRPIGDHHHPAGSPRRGTKEMVMDPHIWLSPRLAKQQAETICRTLIALDPTRKEEYQRNYQLFIEDLEDVDREIRSVMSRVRGRKFLVFHPAWGYFADEYGLEQISIEAEGKEPTAKQLAQLIDQARQNDIKVIFVQSQFNTKPAETIARAIGGQIVQLDPLAEDYLDNLILMAKAIAAGAR